MNQRTQLTPEKTAFLTQRLKPKRKDATHDPFSITKRVGSAPCELSFAQQRLWFLDQMEPNSAAYNLYAAFRLTGPLNTEALHNALNTIVLRHETLRTTFSVSNGRPVQVVAPSLSIPLPRTDLQTVPPDERETEARRLVNEELHSRFHLSNGPLFRAKLLRLQPNEHILTLTMHHIVSDGWSMGILFRELSMLYAAFVNGHANPLPELPIQYADFALWQRNWLKDERLEEHLAYWKKQLTNAPPILELPTDRLRPATQTFAGAAESRSFSTSLTDALKQLSQQEAVTLYMTLLAAFKLLLWRYSGQTDIVIGSPIANRNRTEIEDLIGFFVNTLILRTDTSGNPTFRELLARVKKTALDAYDHQDIPFEKLVEELQPKRSLSHTPLFQVFFNMLNLNEQSLSLKGLTVTYFNAAEPDSKFDLTLYIEEFAMGISLTLVYNSDLFQRERIDQMLDQFHHLLEQIAINPDQNIDSFSLVTTQVEKLLPNPRVPIDGTGGELIYARLAQHAQRIPDKAAVIDKENTWTYQALEARSNQVAHYLHAHGVQSQDVVAVYGTRSATLVWSLLGILKAGAAFTILDPNYPTTRLITALELVKPRACLQLETPRNSSLCQSTRKLADYHTLKLTPDAIRINDPLADYATTSPDIAVSPNNLAYIIFTSGTTGKPKAIQGTHQPVSHFLAWQAQTFNLNQDDRFSMLSGLAHDILLRDIFAPLWLGATLCISNHDFYPDQLVEMLKQYQISITHLTPAMAQFLTAASNTQIPSLRYLFFGGDKLTKGHLSKMREFAPNATCVNFYGTTETPQAMGYFIPDAQHNSSNNDDEASSETIPLGQGIADAQLLVLNSTRQLAGIGELGEVYVRTPYLTQGYLNDEPLTKDHYISNPFTENSGDRLYRTGDLGRYRPDGMVQFAGRVDNQVKIRGFRIELAEVETAVRQHPKVQDATILAVNNNQQEDKRLIAYVVAHDEHNPPTHTELTKFLAGILPDFMLPSVFVLLPKIPLTPNGKLDRLTLPIPDIVRPDIDNDYVAPRSDIEAKLAAIWANVLGLKQVGIHDDFFDLGGHSLLAVKLFVQLEKSFNRKLPYATLFRAATVAQLAQIIEQETRASDWAPLVAIQPEGTQPPFFCVHGWGGGVVGYAELARLLGPDQPFYGIQARGLNGAEKPHINFKEMAADYLKAMRSKQPNGPYYLGGYCQGGVIAFEMACQLREQGEQVALLAIFEGYAPVTERLSAHLRSPRAIVNFSGNLFYLFSDYWSLGTQGIFKRIRRKAGNFWKKRFGKPNTHSKQVDLQDLLDDTSHIPEGLRSLMETHFQAGRAYVPQIYPGQVTLFRVKSMSLLRSFDSHLGWRKLVTGGVEVKMIEGAHRNILEQPYVQSLGRELKLSLRNTQVGTADNSVKQPD